MSNHALFYTSENGDRLYGADDFEDFIKPFYTTGVLNGQLQALSSKNMDIIVKTGWCNVEGKIKRFKTDTTLHLEPADAQLDRIDNIVIRRDDPKRDVYIFIEKGGSGSKPTAPTPVRGNGIYDIVIGQIYVKAGTVKITQDNIRDTRMDAKLCGWVMQTVKEVDLTQIMKQAEAFFKNSRDEFEAFLSAYKAAKLVEFQEWFDSIKNQLEGDAAANLAGKIEELKKQLADEETKIHQFIEQDSRELRQRVDFIEHSLYDEITANPFKISFENIDGFVSFEGILNKELCRIEI